MKKYLLLLLMAVGISSINAQKADPKELAAIHKLSNQWMVATKEKDKATLDKIMSPDFILTSRHGDSLSADAVSRSTWMTNALEHLKIEKFSYNNMRIRINRDTAVVQSGFYWEVTFDDSPLMKDSSELVDTWVRHGKEWMVIRRVLVEK